MTYASKPHKIPGASRSEYLFSDFRTSLVEGSELPPSSGHLLSWSLIPPVELVCICGCQAPSVLP